MRQIFFTLLLVLGALHVSIAQNNWVGIHNAQPTASDIRLEESSIDNTRIRFSIEGYYENAVRTPQGTESIISLQSGALITEQGKPDLGKLYTNIIIPDLYETDVKIITAKYEEFSNISVAPSKGHFTRDINPEDVPFLYDEVYHEDAFWPGKLAQLEDPFIMRDFRGQTVTVFPLQYNPVTKTLRVYTDIIIEVSSTGQPGTDALVRKSDQINIEKDFGQIYSRFFLNMDAASKNYQLLEGEEGSMLIIAYDSFMDAMQPFVNWKRQTGRKTIMVSKSEAGSNATAIKNFVQAYYDENPDFAHLLLVGDGPQIPPVNASGGQSDNAYGFLLGNNSYNDIFVGRFSAETVAHVETQVERMIHYERDITESDTWLANAMGIARNEGTGSGHNGENDYQHMDFIRDTLLNYTYTNVSKRYDGNVPGVPNTTPALMSAEFNEGVGAVNFCNHGSVDGWSVANYNISHVNQLTNVGMLPFIWSVACVNGNFVNNYCFAEAWMRATHNDQPAGAIGTMMSTINQPWQPPMTGQDEMVTLLAEMSIYQNISTYQRTFGGLSINGSMAMIPAHGTSGISTHQTWILFGDPSLKVRTAPPSPFLITYAPVILIGTSSFEVTIADAEGATVALTYYDEMQEEVVIAGTGLVTGGTASVEFDAPVEEPGNMTLTVMGFNKVTYINEEIQVIPPEGPYVVFDAYEIIDATGNNNNQADYGETISLNLSLKNVGIENATNVNATLTTESEYVSITLDQQSWGNIQQDDMQLVEGAFVFEVEHEIPDNHTVMFSLDITGEDEEGAELSWSSNFALKIYSPVLSIGVFEIDDSENDDANGRLDPGETADIKVKVTNNGGAPAMASTASLEASSPYLTILEGSHQLDILLPGEYAEIAFTVHAHASVINGTMVDLLFSAQDNHLTESEQVLIIGQVPEDQIGNGNTPSNQYPFYNYYKANRSQMIYTAEELGAGEKTIMELGFDITQVATQHNNLPNFVIRMMHIEQDAFGSAFINTANAEVVFEASTYQMPEATGWHNWEIEPFAYDGESNLLVEIVWGLLPNWAFTYYRVASTNVGANRVAYGFSDTQANPSFNGNSQVRPNLHLSFSGQATEPEQLVTFQITDGNEMPIPNSWIELGSAILVPDETGEVSLELLPGTYTFDAHAEYMHPMMALSFTLQDEPIIVDVIFAQEGMFVLNLSVNPANAGTVAGSGLYEEGDIADITATAETGYEFVHWADNDNVIVSDQPDFQFTMPDNFVALTAHFQLITYTLLYHAGENGTLEGDTHQTVSHGHNATTVVAVPDFGYHFVQWSDGVTSASRTDLNILDHLDVTAEFAINTYTLTYLADSNGSVEGEAVQVLEHGQSGTSVTAIPNTGYHFVQWSDGVTAPHRTDENILDDLTVTAEFAINNYLVTYLAGPNGSIVGNTMQTVEHGASGVLVSAVADEGHHFVQWSDGRTAISRIDTNITSDFSVTAEFAINQYSLFINFNGSGRVTIDDNPYQPVVLSHGRVITLQATPAEGYRFNSWTGSVESDQAQIEVEMTGNTSLTVNFEEVPMFLLELETDPVNSGSFTGGGNYAEGTRVDLSVNPNEGFIFSHWVNQEGDTLSNERSLEYTMPAQNSLLVAVLKFDPVSVTEQWQHSALVYPNPATDQFKIQHADIIQSVRVYSLSGQLLREEVIGNRECTLTVDQLKEGVYLLEVITESRKEILRLVIQ